MKKLSWIIGLSIILASTLSIATSWSYNRGGSGNQRLICGEDIAYLGSPVQHGFPFKFYSNKTNPNCPSLGDMQWSGIIGNTAVYAIIIGGILIAAGKIKK